MGRRNEKAYGLRLAWLIFRCAALELFSDVFCLRFERSLQAGIVSSRASLLEHFEATLEDALTRSGNRWKWNRAVESTCETLLTDYSDERTEEFTFTTRGPQTRGQFQVVLTPDSSKHQRIRKQIPSTVYQDVIPRPQTGFLQPGGANEKCTNRTATTCCFGRRGRRERDLLKIVRQSQKASEFQASGVTPTSLYWLELASPTQSGFAHCSPPFAVTGEP